MSDVTIPGGKIRAFVERIENLDTELLELNEQKKEVFAEAKGEGFDVKILKEIIKLRKQDQEERDEREGLLDLYMRAMEQAGPARRVYSISICAPWSRPGQRRSPRLHDEVRRVRSPQLWVIPSHRQAPPPVRYVPRDGISGGPRELSRRPTRCNSRVGHCLLLSDHKIGRIVTLLPDREMATVEAWLAGHPDITVLWLDCIVHHLGLALGGRPAASFADRKSTRLNSSHL